MTGFALAKAGQDKDGAIFQQVKTWTIGGIFDSSCGLQILSIQARKS